MGQFTGFSQRKKDALKEKVTDTTTNRTDYASKKTMSGVSIKGSNGLAAEVAKSENNLTAIFDAKEETNYSFSGA